MIAQVSEALEAPNGWGVVVCRHTTSLSTELVQARCLAKDENGRDRDWRCGLTGPSPNRDWPAGDRAETQYRSKETDEARELLSCCPCWSAFRCWRSLQRRRPHRRHRRRRRRRGRQLRRSRCRIRQFQLPNGLNVILHQDKSVPVVAVNVWYHVGSANEKPGRTGFAHLFEHLMFEGSKNVQEGEFDTLLEAAGAQQQRIDEQRPDELRHRCAVQRARARAVPRVGSHGAICSTR